MADYAWSEPGRAQYIGRPHVTKEIEAENLFTAATYLAVPNDWAGVPSPSISVSGTFTATVTLQRSFDDGDTWLDVEQYTAPTEKQLENGAGGIKWRLGVKEGDFTSGTVNCRLSQV